jgi:tRNA-dihydrouridine synthase B
MLTIGTHKISRPYILAPMAGVSQMPFRRLALRYGAGLAPTELISSKGLVFENYRTRSYLTYDAKVERPFCVQLFGGESESMAVAAEKAQAMGAQIIDINMGCPVKKVTKTNAGSALLCDIHRAVDIVTAMQRATGYKIPITAKIRSGFTSENLNYIEVGRALADVGVAAIALHARTRAQGYSGHANWDHIARLKDAVKIPVIGNGDIHNAADATRMFKQTGCDAVMIGRAALGNPWIFQTLDGEEKKVSGAERWAVVSEHLREHLRLQEELWVNEPTQRKPFCPYWAIKIFRSHLLWYSRGLTGGAPFRVSITRLDSFAQTVEMAEEFFTTAQVPTMLHDDNDGDQVDYRQAFG